MLGCSCYIVKKPKNKCYHIASFIYYIYFVTNINFFMCTQDEDLIARRSTHLQNISHSNIKYCYYVLRWGREYKKR